MKDNGPQIINWKMRNKLTTINGNPAKFWIHGTWDAEMKLMLRTNLFVTHIFPMSVNTKTVRMMYDSRKVSEVQHFISENRASISSIRRKILTQTTGDDHIIMTGISWESCRGGPIGVHGGRRQGGCLRKFGRGS